jgi:hypothetical protein
MGPLIQVFETFNKASVPNRQAGSQPDHCLKTDETPNERSQKALDGASIHDVGERANLTYVSQNPNDSFAPNVGRRGKFRIDPEADIEVTALKVAVASRRRNWFRCF